MAYRIIFLDCGENFNILKTIHDVIIKSISFRVEGSDELRAVVVESNLDNKDILTPIFNFAKSLIDFGCYITEVKRIDYDEDELKKFTDIEQKVQADIAADEAADRAAEEEGVDYSQEGWQRGD